MIQSSPLRYGGDSGGGSRSGSSGGGGSSASQRRADADNKRQEAQRQSEQRKQDAQRKREEADQKRQRAADAKANIQGMILDMTDPFGAAMHRVNRQVADFREQAKEGLIPKSLVDQFAKLAIAEVKEERRQQQIQFGQVLLQFVNPALATMIDINEQVREFQKLADQGLVPQSRIDQFKRLATATAQIDRALEAISGGGGSNIKHVGDAFKSFIEAGSPEKSDAVQAMEKLQEQFAGLVESAKILGLSTEDLERSYLAQAKTIRDDAIKAINEEMDARKDQLKEIDDFLAQLRVSDVLPMNLRFGEARAQFGESVKGGDVREAVAASQQYLQIAQEQFGTTSQFFSARNEVERMLTNLRDQQARNIEAEREKAILQEERQTEQVRISRSSVDYLRRISNDNSVTSRGIQELIHITRSQTEEQVATRQLLLRLAAKIKA